jgi:hypothetical protein
MLCTQCLKKNPKTNGYELIEREHFVSRTGAVSRNGPGLYIVTVGSSARGKPGTGSIPLKELPFAAWGGKSKTVKDS